MWIMVSSACARLTDIFFWQRSDEQRRYAVERGGELSGLCIPFLRYIQKSFLTTQSLFKEYCNFINMWPL